MRRRTSTATMLAAGGALCLAVTLGLPGSAAWAHSGAPSAGLQMRHPQKHHKKPRVAKPSITEFSAAPLKVSGKGGRVALSGRVTNASSCTFGSTPRLAGLPKAISCSSGSADLSVPLPANSGDTVRSFTFSLKAVKGSMSASRSVSVQEEVQPPLLRDFAIKPATLSYTGGRVTVSLEVARATSCELTSSPGLAHLPERLSCSGGTVRAVVVIPAGTASARYRLILTASGPGGRTSVSGLVSRAAEPRPTIGTIGATPQQVPAAGGSVSLSDTVSHASSCTYSVTPSLEGFPDTVSCKGGTADAQATIPANSSSQRISYSFSLTATGPGGTTSSANHTTVTEAAASGVSGYPVTWSTGPSIEPSPTVFHVVSCPTSSFCAAGDLSSGEVNIETSGTWGTATEVASEGITQLSCAGSSLCLATDGTNLYLYDGSSWAETSSPFVSDVSIAALACAPGGLCMVTDASGDVATTTDGSSWATTASIPNGDFVDALSCPASTACVAVAGPDSTSYATDSWNGTSWTTGGTLSASDFLAGLACSSGALCVATVFDQSTSSELLEVYSAASWGASSLPTGYSVTDGISCVASGSCLAIGGNNVGVDELFSYSSGSWSAVSDSSDAPYVDGLSCTSDTSCTGVSGPEAFGFDGSSWSNTTIGWAGEVSSISCPTAAWCMAVDSAGNAASYDGSSWSSPAAITDNAILGVSCPSSSFCAAVDAAGNLLTYNGSSWSTTTGVLSGFVLGGDPVSCANASFCVVAFGSQVAYYDGTDWSAATIDSSDSDLSGVACSSATACVAVDGSGKAFSYNGSSWSGATIDSHATSSESAQVACLSATTCVAAGTDGYAEVLSGASWSAPAAAGGGSGFSAVSCDTSENFCALATFEGIYYLQESSGAYAFSSSPQSVGGALVLGLSCSGSSCLATTTSNGAYYATSG